MIYYFQLFPLSSSEKCLKFNVVRHIMSDIDFGSDLHDIYIKDNYKNETIICAICDWINIRLNILLT